MKIKSIYAYEVLASGGYPTLETIATLEDGTIGRASVPYGASAGSHEASVLTDGDQARYAGKGVKNLAEKINNEIGRIVIAMDAENQQEVDRKLLDEDATPTKTKLGGNVILSISLATARAAANAKKIGLYKHINEVFSLNNDFSSLPNPMVVAIEGGKHADNSTDLQEYCISGVSTAGPTENIRKALETYHTLGKIMKQRGFSINVGNEGAFAPDGITSNELPCELITEAISQAGYQAKTDLGISIDAAASEFYQDGNYNLKVENRIVNSDELLAIYDSWLKKYPIITVEDLFNEDDWEAWVKAQPLCAANAVTLIGDDLTVTNVERLQKAIDLKAISGIIIKPNQIGSLTETVETCKLAKSYGITTTTSHRGGGETNDTLITDVAVAVGSKFMKVGPTRGERVEKYNRLMEIERELQAN